MHFFNNNLIRPSSEVGLHPQLVHYDITRSDGINVGINRKQTVSPGQSDVVAWYAGDVLEEPFVGGRNRPQVNLVPTPGRVRRRQPALGGPRQAAAEGRLRGAGDRAG